MLKDFARSVLIALLSAMVFAGPAAKIARGQAVQGYPLTANNFVETTPHGFGDFNNSWAQAMVWWNNNLYVGTSRDSLCASLEGVHLEGIALLGLALANQYLPYPPPDPNLTCTPDPADLPLAAQIWQWSPGTNAWTQVYESPDVLPNPGHGPPDPPETGKFLPYEASFRGFAPYTESDGTQALYAFGVNSTLLWDSTKLPPPRILRTTDGANWTPLPQDPGTFLGDLPFNSDHSTYRSPVVYNGIMFSLCGPINGQGSLIASFNPSQGDNAWFLAAPASMFFYELATFNGWLYLGAYNPGTGYGVYKTNAQGMPPYQLIQIVPPGAGLTNMPSPSVVSMFVHNNRLYVGTATFPEMLRINTDDTWDLVMGAPRIDPVTEEWKYPISNVGPGFGLTLNDHVWYMADANNYLYAGTYNASTGSHTDPVYGPILQPTMGAQMFVTGDDWHWTAVTTNGFSNPADPHGGMWDYGFRTMSNTPYGMFVGTANDYYGLTVFRATKGVSPPVQAPGNLEIEPTQSGGALLSWQAGIYATSYEVWRAVLIPIQIRYNFNFEGFNGIPVGSVFITDMYVSPYQSLGTTTSLTFLDSTPEAGHTYMYYIVATGSRGTSPPSNLTTFPNLLPPVTFAQLITEVNTLAQRQRFASTDPGGTKTLTVVETAQAQAAACQITAAIKTLTPQTNSRAVLVPDLYDYQAVIAKMIRRLQNYTTYPTQVISNEFCTP